jgi:glc operon protein GlcG
MANVTLKEAVTVCEAAIARAKELGITIAVSVVDSGTNLVTMQKMENALLLGIEGSKGKAVASVLFGESSGDLIPRNDSPVMRALQIQMGGRFILGRGAVPIFRDSELIGACGAGGGTGEEDEDCSRAGAAAIG